MHVHEILRLNFLKADCFMKRKQDQVKLNLIASSQQGEGLINLAERLGKKHRKEPPQCRWQIPMLRLSNTAES